MVLGSVSQDDPAVLGVSPPGIPRATLHFSAPDLRMVKRVRGATGSPLRYPGSKARLAKFIAHTILLNGFDHPLFVECFCGGASVSIALLEANIVEEVVLNDIDPLVAGLWKCIFSPEDAKWLAETVMEIPLTLEQWYYQKALKPENIREQALKCLYLNRTSFSGLLDSRAGPIGGRAQIKWTIGCRFNRKRISSRISALASLRDRVRAVTQKGWEESCNDWATETNKVFYLDPPFYHKADRLYRYTFSQAEHGHLRDYLSIFQSPWLLSYDNSPEVRSLYDRLQCQARIIDNTYSAHPAGGNSFIGREVLYSSLISCLCPTTKRPVMLDCLLGSSWETLALLLCLH